VDAAEMAVAAANRQVAVLQRQLQQHQHQQQSTTATAGADGANVVIVKGNATTTSSGNVADAARVREMAQLLTEQEKVVTELERRNRTLEQRLQVAQNRAATALGGGASASSGAGRSGGLVLSLQMPGTIPGEPQQQLTPQQQQQLTSLVHQFTATAATAATTATGLDESVGVDQADQSGPTALMTRDALSTTVRLLLLQLKWEQRQRLHVEEQAGRMAAAQDQLLSTMEARVRELEAQLAATAAAAGGIGSTGGGASANATFGSGSGASGSISGSGSGLVLGSPLRSTGLGLAARLLAASARNPRPSQVASAAPPAQLMTDAGHSVPAPSAASSGLDRPATTGAGATGEGAGSAESARWGSSHQRGSGGDGSGLPEPRQQAVIGLEYDARGRSLPPISASSTAGSSLVAVASGGRAGITMGVSSRTEGGSDHHHHRLMPAGAHTTTTITTQSIPFVLPSLYAEYDENTPSTVAASGTGATDSPSPRRDPRATTVAVASSTAVPTASSAAAAPGAPARPPSLSTLSHAGVDGSAGAPASAAAAGSLARDTTSVPSAQRASVIAAASTTMRGGSVLSTTGSTAASPTLEEQLRAVSDEYNASLAEWQNIVARVAGGTGGASARLAL
jgi:hypothetical protein